MNQRITRDQQVAIYIRISTDKEGEAPPYVPGSLHKQLEDIVPWASKQGLLIAKLYIDRGSSEDHHRPGLEELMRMALSPQRSFNRVIVHHETRLHRSPLQRATLEKDLQKAGVSVVSVTANDEEIPPLLSSPVC